MRYISHIGENGNQEVMRDENKTILNGQLDVKILKYNRISCLSMR